MQVWVTDKSKVAKMQSKHDITHVLSLLDIGDRPFLHPHRTIRQNCLLLNFEDEIHADHPGAPTKAEVEKILAFGKALPADARLLVHCFAGVSRSTAAALAIMVQHHGLDKIDDCINMLVEQRPQACPNPVITRYADDLLEANGKLFEAGETCANKKLLKLWGGELTSANFEERSSFN